MWLTRLALRNPILILMLSLAVTVLGVVSVSRLPVDLFPDISIPVLNIVTFYDGAAPRDIEKSISYPIEKAVSAVSGIEHVESKSKQGVSSVSVYFEYGTNLDSAEVEVIQRLQQVLYQLPPGVQQPFVMKFDLSNIPACNVTVSGPGLDGRRLYDLAFNVIEPQLEHLPHVASADVEGGKIRQINVEVDRDALKARGLGIDEIVKAISATNLLLPSGDLRAGPRDYNLFTNTQVLDPKELTDVVVRADANGVVHLRDVARVIDGAQEQTNIVRLTDLGPDGKLRSGDGVFLRVLKQPGANTIAIVDAVRAALPHLHNLPAGVKLDLNFDQSTYIRNSMDSLKHEALFGSLLAVLVILLFLRSVRSTLIIAVAIPLSIVATFILLFFTGQSLNIFTLGGLALGVGRLVDDSIVELENIQRHLDQGKLRMQAALEAAEEVAMPILVSTITTIVVFFPVVFLSGVSRLLFIPLTLTIAFSLMASFVVSRTVTPILCVRVLRPEAPREHGFIGWLDGGLRRFFDQLDTLYQHAIGWSLRHRAPVVLAVLAAFTVSVLVVLPRVGKDFFPATDESQFTINTRLPVGSRIEASEALIESLEKDVVAAIDPAWITTMLGRAGIPPGRSAVFSGNTGPHAGSFQVKLVPPTERPYSDLQLMERVRKRITGRYPGTKIYFSTGGIMSHILNFGSDAPVDVEVTGYDLDAARDYTRQLTAALRQVPGLEDLNVSRENDYPEIDVLVDREKAGALGFPITRIADTVLTSMAGNTNAPTMYTDPITGNEFGIVVRFADRFRQRVEDLKEVYLPSPTTGQPVSLGTLARLRRSSGPVQIDRKYQQRIVHITGNPVGRDLDAVSADVERAIAQVPLPPGFQVTLGGQTATQRAAFQSLLLALLLALMLVYMVMASQFRSLVDPLIIMVSVPMGLIGVFVALWLTRTPLSVNAYMGIIMMVGIVVSNGVLLVDYARVRREHGEPLVEAVVNAGRTRLRPILMTTLATVLGLIPMALGIGEGSESNVPLARAVIGGLVVSTALTLLLVPTLYVAAEQRLARFHRDTPELVEDRKALEG